jgi:Holliday junction DNA helicase RuvA
LIGYLSGRVIASHGYVNTVAPFAAGSLGIGYEVHVNGSNGVGSICDLWIHEHAPQDAPHELYGFDTLAERELFRRLLDIKGVGPKVAMRIVASDSHLPRGTSEGFVYQETRDDLIDRLTKIRGVGSTLAQRIAEEMVCYA